MRIALILLIVLYAVKAHSAEDFVLFLDINNSPQEVKAARESAQKSGRKILLYPDISEKDRKKFAQIRNELSAAHQAMLNACSGEKPDPKACEERGKKVEEVSQEKSKFMEAIEVSRKSFAAFLERNKDKKFSSLVISGHDGTGAFSGEFGNIADEHLAAELAKYPAARDSIRSLHLWGCYTTSPGSLLLNWKKHFPNTALITGYEGRAPLNDKPAGWHYLKGVLAREPELVRLGDSAKLQKLLRKIPGANQVTAAIYACGDYASLKEHYNLNDLERRCDSIKPQIQAKGPEFECFLKASEANCANPPEDVGRGPLRQFYELLHKASACGAILEDSIFHTYSRDTAIRLVFGREVQKNFGRIYAKLLGEVDETLAKLGAPDHLRFQNIAGLSRRETFQRAEELLAFLAKLRPDPLQDPAQFKVTEREGDIAALGQFQRNLTDVLTQLRADCVPFNWTEPDQKEKSICMYEKWMGKEGTRNFLEADSRLRVDLLYGMASDLESRITEIEDANAGKPKAAEQAKIEEYKAQAEKIRYYSQFEEEKIPPAFLDRIKQREEYAKLVRALAEQGVAQPTQDHRSVKMLLEVNRPEVEQEIISRQREITRLQKSLAEQTNLTADQRSYYDREIKRQEKLMQNEQAVLELTNLITLSQEADSALADKMNALQDQLGHSFREEEIILKVDSLKSYEHFLAQPNLTARTIEDYKAQIKGKEEELQKLRSETPAEIRARGQRYLLKFRAKY